MQQKDPQSSIGNKIDLDQPYKGARKKFGYKITNRGTRLPAADVSWCNIQKGPVRTGS